MASTLGYVKHAAERKAVEVVIDGLFKSAKNSKDKRQTYLTFMGWAEKFFGDKAFPQDKVEQVKKAIQDPDNKWMKFIDQIIDETNPQFAKMTLLNLGYEAFLRGTKTIRANREKYNCNIPWLILFDPTSACNMHCEGCWSGTYGHKNNLSYEDMDKIITQGKELGVYLYLMTGGEPMVRKKDIIRLAQAHPDSGFMLFTNGTLVDQPFIDEIKKSKNIIFSMSIEGLEDATDGRRGSGVFQKVMGTMDLLHKNGIPYGTSICYTSANYKAVTSDDFLDFLIEKGVAFSWYFHFMPVGNDATTELVPTPEEREYMYHRIREVRGYEGGKEIFLMDFQNDGEFVSGCIAGGKYYCHINPNGDVEPCVFIHYSSANIHDMSLLDCLRQPLFKAYQSAQPFNKNLLQPCPMLENPQRLRQMVKESGAKSTDMMSPEDVDHLCSKCDEYAKEWAPVADRLWASNHPGYQPDPNEAPV